jgi:hypothetical protein
MTPLPRQTSYTRMRKQMQNSSVLLTASPVEKMLSCIRKATSGDPKFYNCHPDYATSIDDAKLGTFPDNIKTPLWTHIGFQGSLEDEPIRNSILEINAIWILENRSYANLRFIDYPEPHLDIKVAKDYYTILMVTPSHVYKTYLDETEPEVRGLCPSPIDLKAHDIAFRNSLNYDGTESDCEEMTLQEDDDGDCDENPPRIFIPEFASCSPCSPSPRAPFQEPLPTHSPV